MLARVRSSSLLFRPTLGSSHVILVVLGNYLLLMLVVHGSLQLTRFQLPVFASHFWRTVTHWFEVGWLRLDIVDEIDLLVIVIQQRCPIVIVKSLIDVHLGSCFLSLLPLKLLLALFLSLLLFLKLPLFVLFYLEVVLHFLYYESFTITLIVDACLLVEERFPVVWIEHLFEELLSLLQVAILNDLMCLVAQPQQQAGKQEQYD